MTGRQARGEDKARGRACLFVSSFARHHRKRHFTGAVSSFFSHQLYFLFLFPAHKNKNYQIHDLSMIYCTIDHHLL